MDSVADDTETVTIGDNYSSAEAEMHILPLILAAWSYKQRVSLALEREQPTLIGDRHERGQIGLLGEDKAQSDDVTKLPILRSKSTGLTKEERNSVRIERTADPIDYQITDYTKREQSTNEVKGSHFMTTELCHVGTDAWGSLKNRLAENGIIINDDDVAIAAAGFNAERMFQQITGRHDPERLRSELEGDIEGENYRKEKYSYSAKWIRDINQHPDAEAIALECFEDLKTHYPAALGVDMREADKAIGYNPNVIEVER